MRSKFATKKRAVSSSGAPKMGCEQGYVALPDGRRICYRELGCSAESATRSILVLHGTPSSRIAAIPGVSEDLLQEFGVRLVAVDRPGYGKSDPLIGGADMASVAADVGAMLDRLELRGEVWLLGYSGGAVPCWAAARYLPPGRLSGLCLWAPAGNFWWKGISEEQRKDMFSALTSRSRIIFPYMRLFPRPILRLYARFVLARRAGRKYLEDCKQMLCAADREHLKMEVGSNLMVEDSLESMTFNKGAGVASDLELFTSDWGFELEDVASNFKGSIHIWQGSEDNLVPLALQRRIKSIIPEAVELHELPGEGHISWFCFNHDSHRKVFETIFSPERKQQAEAAT